MAKKKGFEEKLSRLDEIARALEQNQSTLEDMLKLYEEGVKTYRECLSILDATEAKIKIIDPDNELERVNDFKEMEES